MSEFYDHLFAQRNANKGNLLLEVDNSCLVPSILDGFEGFEPSEVGRPMYFVGEGVTEVEDVMARFFEQITKNGMFSSVKESVLTGFSGGSAVSEQTLLYLPNPRLACDLFPGCF